LKRTSGHILLIYHTQKLMEWMLNLIKNGFNMDITK